MEERFGFIHDKLEIKLLILFLLARLEAPIDLDSLTEMTLSCDDGISYFAFSECMAELIETAHISEVSEHSLIITDKGRRNGQAMESSIPPTVRKQAEAKATALARVQRRNAMIKTAHKPRRDGGVTVQLALSDGLDEILNMELYAANEAQAAIITESFNKRAEQVYGQIIALLVDDA